MAQISDQIAPTAGADKAVNVEDGFAFGALGLTLLASLAISTVIVPPILLAVGGGIMLFAGLGLAAMTRTTAEANGRRAEGGERVSRRDIAALLVLLGFAASILSGPTSLLI
jgi:hypothetical protein